MHRSQLRTASLVLSLTSGLTGCYTWAPGALTTGDAQTPAASARPARVTLVNGGTLELRGVRMSGDSLVGEGGEPPRRIAVVRTDVRSVDERRLHPVRTTAAVVGLTAGTAFLVLLAIGASQGFGLGAAY